MDALTVLCAQLTRNLFAIANVFYAVRISISTAILSEIFIQISYFLSRVSTLTHDIDKAILSVCLFVRPSVRNVPESYENGLTYSHSFFSPYGRPIILVLSASKMFTKF